MAARIFPNTVYVSGFPGQVSRGELLQMFGGKKGYIKDLQFTQTPGESKKAFIVYADERSVPLALKMSGRTMYHYTETLEVRLVDERVLCEHVPGELYNESDAFENLQAALNYAIRDWDLKESTLQLEITRLQERVGETDRWKREAAAHKTHKENVEQELKAQLASVRAQLQTAEGRISQLEAQCGVMGISMKKSQELVGVRDNEIQDLQRLLDQTREQKESAIERLGVANNKAATLEEELKVAKTERFEARSTLWRTESSLDDATARLRMAESRAENAEKKRTRAEEWLTDERDSKRRAVLDFREMEEHYKLAAEEVENGYLEKLDTLKERLRMEYQGRREAEDQLTRANSALEKGMVTDALLAAFVKMDNWTMRVLGDEHGQAVPSPSIFKH